MFAVARYSLFLCLNSSNNSMNSNLQFTRETCFEPSTSVLVTGGPPFSTGTQYSEAESATASKEAAADCLYDQVSSASQENSGSDWMISFTALQEPSVLKELTSGMSPPTLHLQLEDEHYIEPISCTDANTPRTFAAHYSVEETDPTSRGVIIVATDHSVSTVCSYACRLCV